MKLGDDTLLPSEHLQSTTEDSLSSLNETKLVDGDDDTVTTSGSDSLEQPATRNDDTPGLSEHKSTVEDQHQDIEIELSDNGAETTSGPDVQEHPKSDEPSLLTEQQPSPGDSIHEAEQAVDDSAPTIPGPAVQVQPAQPSTANATGRTILTTGHGTRQSSSTSAAAARTRSTIPVVAPQATRNGTASAHRTRRRDHHSQHKDVVKTYPGVLSGYVGGWLILFGLMAIGFNAAGIAVGDQSAPIGHGIWCGVMIRSFMIVSVISSVLALFLFAFGFFGGFSNQCCDETKCTYCNIPALAMEAMLIVVGFFAAVASMRGVIITLQVMCDTSSSQPPPETTTTLMQNGRRQVVVTVSQRDADHVTNIPSDNSGNSRPA